LGASRTLILVDGQRILSKDLNTIPTAAIQRVEVLTSGASAIYGSDAIGGVINFILKSHYQGAQFSINFGEAYKHDAKRRGASFVFGQTSDKGSILAGVSYNKFNVLKDTRRPISKNALSLTTTANGKITAVEGGSSFTPNNFISINSSLGAKFGCPAAPGANTVAVSLKPSTLTPSNSPTTPSDYECFGAENTYDYAHQEILVPPQDRTNAFIRGTYDLTSNVKFSALLLHNNTSSESQEAPALFGVNNVGGLTISKDSFYNPFGVDFSPNGALWRTRLLPTGNRVFPFSTTTDQLITSLHGFVNVLGRSWQWDVGYNYGRRSQVSKDGGQPLISDFLQGMGPSFKNSDGVVQCGTPTAPIPLSDCTPFDPFNLLSANAQKVVGAAAATGIVNTWSIGRDEHADVNGGLFDLPAGTMELALGVAHRKRYRNSTVGPALLLDPATGACTLPSGCTSPLQGGFSVKEAYGELFIPILQDMPLAHGLNVTLGDRYSKYSDFGHTNNWKFGMEYRPISDLLLRGTIASVFRAPTISDVFAAPTGGNASGGFISHDPCAGITAPNPACVGVPTDGSFKDNLVTQHTEVDAITTGSAFANFPLGPEVGKSFDFGAVYSPHFVPGLSLSTDFWRIYLQHTITSVGSETVLDECFSGASQFCPLISRVQSGVNAGQIRQLTLPTANLGRIDVKGIDFSGNYRLPAFAFGQITLNVNATYLTQFKIETAPGTPGNSVFHAAGQMGWDGSSLEGACPFGPGLNCFFPRINAIGTVDWQLGGWNATWTMRYKKAWRMAPPLTGVRGLDHYGSYVYNNLQVGYDVKAINTTISAGVNNMFNKQPPLLYYTRSNNANTAPDSFDVVGRFYWARVTVDF
jgi:outer membrane receptor protein involved in Fe transport